jgi:regulator of RNase E activity RraA
MGSNSKEPITLSMIRQSLYTAVVCDALDSLGYTNQSPRVPWVALPPSAFLVGRCKTTLWGDMYHQDPKPYELELRAVDTCRPDDVLIAAAGGSLRSAVWGELLSTAAKNSGCIGAIVDGAVRDTRRMEEAQFPVFARGTCPYDSMNRQRVVDLDVPVEIDRVRFSPGDLVLADRDGVVVVPAEVEQESVRRAWDKVHAENEVRDAIRAGMTATEAYARYGVL